MERHRRDPIKAVRPSLRGRRTFLPFREQVLDDLELGYVDRRIHVHEDHRVAQHLFNAEVEHDAVAAMQFDRMFDHLHDFLGGKHLGHVDEHFGIRRIVVDRLRRRDRAAPAPPRCASPCRRLAMRPPDA